MCSKESERVNDTGVEKPPCSILYIELLITSMGIVTWYGWRGYGTISMSSTEESIGPLTLGVAVERYLYDVVSV